MSRKYCHDIHVAMGQGTVWIGFGYQWEQILLSHKMMNQPRMRKNWEKLGANTDKNLGQVWLVSLRA